MNIRVTTATTIMGMAVKASTKCWHLWMTAQRSHAI
jgi:hypothetical protein